MTACHACWSLRGRQQKAKVAAMDATDMQHAYVCMCVVHSGAVCDAVACGHRYGRYTCNGIHYLNDVLLRCGQAVYLKLALINHSCRPNCFVTFESGTLQGLWLRPCASH